MPTQNLRPEDIDKDMARQLESLQPQGQKKIATVVGRVMHNMIMIRFLRGAGPNNDKWTSWSSKTQQNGRWSANYKKRPSGAMITADKIRLIDTRTLANSYKRKIKPGFAEVGPTGERNKKIAENEANHGNDIVGWDAQVTNATTMEMQAFVDRMALGLPPRAIPVSSIGKKRIRVSK